MRESLRDLNRSDIRVDPSDGSIQPGYPVSLALNVMQLTDCVLTPLTGAYVDIWHCNSLGLYSDRVGRNGGKEIPARVSAHGPSRERLFP